MRPETPLLRERQRWRRPVGGVCSPHAEKAAFSFDHSEVAQLDACPRGEVRREICEQMRFQARAERAILEQKDQVAVLAPQDIGALHRLHAEAAVSLEAGL